MKSQSRQKAQLDGITIHQSRVLIECLAASSLHDKALIRGSFHDRASSFEKTVEFLTSLNIIRKGKSSLLPGTHYSEALACLDARPIELVRLILEMTIKSSSAYGNEVRSLISEFQSINGVFQMVRLDTLDSRYAARNLLIEADMLVLDHSTGRCEISPEFHDLFILGRYSRGITPKMLLNSQKKRAEIGFSAELAVLEYERKLVGKQYASQVIHVAANNVEAGFDIASVRVDGDRISESRLIEVKAVNESDYGFFWTENELSVADLYQECYYLYLVPFCQNTPSLFALRIIQNPIQHVLGEGSGWEVSRNTVYCCEKRAV